MAYIRQFAETADAVSITLSYPYVMKHCCGEDKIAVCVEVNAVNQSDDTVTLLYAVRDASGNVVNDVSRELAWDSLWYNRRHANAVPLPAAQGEASVAGSYTLEIYINGKLLASTGFTIA